MTKSKSILVLKNAKDVYSFLQEPTIAIAEGLTGILASDQTVHKLSTGRIVQAAVKGNLYAQLGREIKKYRDAGKIKEDYFATNKNQATLLELLQFIDSDIPDEEIFKAMKSIFFSGIAKSADEREEEISYQLLLLCKKLSSMEVLILRTCYQIYRQPNSPYQNITSFGEWARVVSEKIGYELPELVSASDDKLISMGLLSDRKHNDRSGVSRGQEFRLTKLSIKLCERIFEWEEV